MNLARFTRPAAPALMGALLCATLLGGARAGVPAHHLAPAPAPQLLAADENDKLLPIGKEAPDFNLPLAGGGEVSLANTLKVSKLVLVTFWSAKSAASAAEFKYLQKVYDDYQDKGLDIIAVNPVELTPAVQKYMMDGQFTFKAAIDGKETNHAVTGVYEASGRYPTTYLLDNKGKVLWRESGYTEAHLKQALASNGLK